MTIQRYKAQSISKTVQNVAQSIFVKRGFSNSKIITDWESIAGKVLAKHTIPDKITYPRNERGNGTLHIRTSSPALALELQHLEVQLIERINMHFGYRAVDKIKIVHGSVQERKIKQPSIKRKITLEEQITLDESLRLIVDPELKQALHGLGREVKTTK